MTTPNDAALGGRLLNGFDIWLDFDRRWRRRRRHQEIARARPAVTTLRLLSLKRRRQ